MPQRNTIALERRVARQCNKSQAVEVMLKHFVTCGCSFSYYKMSQDDMTAIPTHEVAHRNGRFLDRI
jgi:hypothetical protein